MDMTSISNNEIFDGFFSDFFKNFSIESESTAVKETVLPQTEEEEKKEMEFSIENTTFPEQEIPEVASEPSASQEDAQGIAEHKVEEMPEGKSSEEPQEPVPQLRQFPKQLGEQLKREIEDEVKDFKSMSDIEIKEDIKPFTVTLMDEMDFDAPETTEALERFSIVDDKCADWALKKIREEQREYLRLKELADEEIADLKEKQQKAEKRFENSTRYLKSLLQEYFLSVPGKKETKTQETYKLLNGKLVMKKSSTNYEKDQKTLLDFLKTNKLNQFIKTEEKVDWEKLKKSIDNDGTHVVLKDTGVCVEGVSIKEIPSKFDVKFED